MSSAIARADHTCEGFRIDAECVLVWMLVGDTLCAFVLHGSAALNEARSSLYLDCTNTMHDLMAIRSHRSILF